jgi:hypothetical protein
MSLKTIKVNPIFLMGSGGGGSSQAKNKTRKEKPVSLSLGQPNSIKKKLIARIKNFQQNKNTTATTNNNDDGFTNDFSESVQFLDNLARDKQEHKLNKHNATLKKKQPRNEAAYMQIATELPPELLGGLAAPLHPPVASLVPKVEAFSTPSVQISPTSGGLACVAGGASPPWSAPPAPSYSNLKTGGTKPTYRNWLRNTQKNKHVTPVVNKPISILEEISQPIISPSVPSLSTHSVSTPSLPSALAQTAATLSISTEPVNIPTVQFPTVQFPTVQTEQPQPINPGGVAGGVTPPLYRPTLFRKRKKVTRTLKYKLGKHANGKVSVLIKNNQTRRRVQTEQAQLKLKSILDIKNHLRSKNLLKAGSEAPNDVLRHIYEQSILAGQIENKSKDTLIHNYFNEEKK